MQNMAEEKEQLEFTLDNDIFPRLLGVEDANLRYLDSRFRSQLTARGGRICVRGPADEVDRVRRVFTDLEALYRERREVTIADIDVVLRLAGFDNGNRSQRQEDSALVLEVPRGIIQPHGAHQEHYVRAMEHSEIVLPWGPPALERHIWRWLRLLRDSSSEWRIKLFW
ncbi:MAG: hypothetical protein V2A61_04020 [Calditrichota bacterium]